MNPEAASAWLQFFREAGGWGVSGVELWFIIRLLKEKNAMVERVFTLLDVQNKIFDHLKLQPPRRELAAKE